jgi:ABC-type multidrug transport system fused ATPase/permease subunit
LLHGGQAPVLAGGLLLMAFLIAPTLTIFLGALGGLIWLAAGPLQASRRAEEGVAARDSALGLLQLHEDLAMLRTVRVFGMEGIDRQRFEAHLRDYQAADERRMRTSVAMHPVLVLSIGAAAFLGLGMLVHAVLTGRLGLASALVVAGLLATLAWPLWMWRERRRALQVADRAATSLFTFLERRPELQMTVGARFLPPIRDAIRLDDVRVDDAGGRTLLSGVSATIPARSRAAFVGIDEDAKHAVACLIPRLLDPTRGRVLIDGRDLRDVTLESLRAQVALILEADYVFSDAVFHNIGLGEPGCSIERVVEAAKVAHVHQVIQQLPEGYDTVIGPLGHPLKPDEQYRVALARAVLHDASIVILEEPREPLEEGVKLLVDDTIERLAKNRTLVFLPHRLSTIRKCDQVILLHNGRVEAAGHPRDLQGQSKLFRHIQYLEFNPFAAGEPEPGIASAG